MLDVNLSIKLQTEVLKQAVKENLTGTLRQYNDLCYLTLDGCSLYRLNERQIYLNVEKLNDIKKDYYKEDKKFAEMFNMQDYYEAIPTKELRKINDKCTCVKIISKHKDLETWINVKYLKPFEKKEVIFYIQDSKCPAVIISNPYGIDFVKGYYDLQCLILPVKVDKEDE